MSDSNGMQPLRAVGLMVGTSLDGVDAALVEAPSLDRLTELEVRVHQTQAFVDWDGARVREIAGGASTTAEELSALRFALADEHVRAVERVCAEARLSPSDLHYVAAHGVTLWHAPGSRGGHGWQLHAGSVLAGRLGCPVVDEFRAADIALGGEGAPLAPLADLGLRVSEDEDRGILNLGGIANLTLLPAGARSTAELVAGDVGPANLPLDAIAREDFGQDWDRDGVLSANGRVLPSVVAEILQQDWVRRPLPRSFGREEFGSVWLEELRRQSAGAEPADRLATVVEIEARALAILLEELAGKWRRRTEKPWSLYLTGGGRHNVTWVSRARTLLPGARVTGIEELGVEADAKEAVDFAFLGGQTLRRFRCGNRAVTGASRDIVLGCVHDPDGRLA